MKHLISLISIFSVSAIACGGGDFTNSGSDVIETDAGGCVPGSSADCAGTTGCEGQQTCNADGSAYEPCDCDAAINTAGGGGGNAAGGSNGVAGAATGGTDSGGGVTGGTSTGGHPSGGSPAGGTDSGSAGTSAGGTAGGSGGAAAGGTDSGPNCRPKSCATLTVELSGNTSGDYDSCGLIEDGCGGYVDCGGCDGKTPYADVYASCNGTTHLCENNCFVGSTQGSCPNSQLSIVCSIMDTSTPTDVPPSNNCTSAGQFGLLVSWCCP